MIRLSVAGVIDEMRLAFVNRRGVAEVAESKLRAQLRRQIGAQLVGILEDGEPRRVRAVWSEHARETCTLHTIEVIVEDVPR